VAVFTALFDANVLYPAPTRDLLLELATTGLFRARWTNDIHDEWVHNLLKDRPDLDPARLARTRNLMDTAVPDALVTGHRGLIDGLTLPDPDDRHVLAAAIVGRADVIVTANLKDFPAEALAPHGIEAQHPDTFLIHQRSLSEHLFLESARKVRRRMVKSPKSPDEYLAILEKAGLVLIAAELAKTKKLL
jgi:predicted nucleic acid-binding protein